MVDPKVIGSEFDMVIDHMGFVLRLLIPLETFTSLFSDHYETFETSIIPLVYKAEDRVLEIGSGIGFISCMIGKVVDTLVGLEALPGYASVAQYNVKLNNLDKVSIFPLIGDVLSGKSKFNRWVRAYESTMIPTQSTSIIQPLRIIEGESIDINFLINQHNLNCIHMDVEGYEKTLIPHLINGPISKINKLVVEVHPDAIPHKEIYPLYAGLVDCGLEPCFISGRRAFPNISYVIVFCRGEERDRMRGYNSSLGMGVIDNTGEFLEYIKRWADG